MESMPVNPSKPCTATHTEIPRASPRPKLGGVQRNANSPLPDTSCKGFHERESLGSKDSYLYVRRTKTRIHPLRPTLISERGRTSAVLVPNLLLAVQVKRLLKKGTAMGCESPFMVIVSEQRQPPSPGYKEKMAIRFKPLDALLNEYSNVFETPRFWASQNAVRECIELEPEARPPNRPAFRLFIPQRQEVEKRLAELLESGSIQPSRSEFEAPILFVPKPDGTLRMCIDYRALNKVTKNNRHPLPCIDELFDTLSGAKYFSALDLTPGYNQFLLASSDVPKTALNTHIGECEWKVHPMGLSNAPAVFQAETNQFLGPHPNKCVCIYLDDILIFSKTQEEHFQHSRLVLDILKGNDLKAKLSKCDFFKSEHTFLAHIVSAAGMQPDPSKVAVVSDWPVPKNVYEVRSFLGFAN
jgi:hypothetical protein